MFEDALFATNRRQTGQQRWAAMMSFAMQVGLVTVLVALPLFFTEALPLNYVRSIVELPSPPPGPPPTPVHPIVANRRPPTTSAYENGEVVFHPPSKGPIKTIDDKGVPPQPNVDTFVQGGTGPAGNGNDPISQLIGHMPRPVAPPPVPTKPLIVSHIDEGLLVHKVNPVYPQIAQITHQQGTVVLRAIIGRDGTIQQLQAVSGPPLLIKAAADAVGQWRYRPYILNGQPVEVETQITVNFKLGG